MTVVIDLGIGRYGAGFRKGAPAAGGLAVRSVTGRGYGPEWVFRLLGPEPRRSRTSIVLPRCFVDDGLTGWIL